MKKMILSVSALAIAASIGGAALAQEEEVTAWRLFVSDHAAPVVRVIDALDGDTIATFDVKGLATLYRIDSGEAVYARPMPARSMSSAPASPLQIMAITAISTSMAKSVKLTEAYSMDGNSYDPRPRIAWRVTISWSRTRSPASSTSSTQRPSPKTVRSPSKATR